MSAQPIFKTGYWKNGVENSVMNFPVRKFPYDLDRICIDLLHNYSGGSNWHQMVEDLFTWVDGNCDQTFVMEISDHTSRLGPESGKMKDYLDVVINNPNAMIILQNVTEPADILQMKRLGYLCDNMEPNDFINRVMCLVPDQDIVYLYRQYLAIHHNFHDNIYIKDYAGHLVNFNGLKDTDSILETSYSEPRRVGLLNGQHKPFRLYICYKLWQAGLIDKMQVTYWNKMGYGIPEDVSLAQMKEDLDYIERKAKWHFNIDPGFDDWMKTLPAMGGVTEELTYHTTPKGHGFPWCLNESPIHVIPETLFDSLTFKLKDIMPNTVENTFITEKIYRALATGKAFIPMSQIGTLEKLHNMGFKTFEQWWPESDLEVLTDRTVPTPDGPRPMNGHYHRYETMVKIVSDIYNKTDTEFQTMMTEMKPTLLHNQNRMQELIDHQDRNRLEVITKIYNWLHNNE